MSHRPRFNALAIATAVALALPAVAIAKSGDIFVGDDGSGDVVRLNPDTEHQKVIVPEGNSKLNTPVGGSFKGGDLYIADYDLPGVARIDPKTGHVKVIKKNGPFTEPLDLDIGPDGKAYVAEEANPAIVKVNLKSGNTSTVADGDQIVDPYALTFEPSGKILVADHDSGVIEVDPDNGSQTVICDDADIDGAAGVALIGDNIYTNDGGQEIFKVESEHDAVSVASGADLGGVYDLERAPHKKLYAAAANAGNVVLVDPDTGDLDVIGTGDDINTPEGLTVQP